MKAVAFALLVALILTPTVVLADEIVCAAVLPCDDDGSVLPQFSDGECSEHYTLLCAKAAAIKNADLLNSCGETATELSKVQEQLKRQLGSLRLQLRAARRNRSR